MVIFQCMYILLGRTILTLFILSDCYLGLDQQYDIQLEIIESLPNEQVPVPILQDDKL